MNANPNIKRHHPPFFVPRWLRRLLAAVVVYDVLRERVSRRTLRLARWAEDKYEAIDILDAGNPHKLEINAYDAKRSLVTEIYYEHTRTDSDPTVTF
jgi:hypothetical protein